MDRHPSDAPSREHGQPGASSAGALGGSQVSPIAYTPRHLAERILAEQAALEARGAPDGERKTITALFADIKGSMDLAGRPRPRGGPPASSIRRSRS